ncbi:MAG: hypothetical protein QGI60_02035, partial [archaeon]|nr:hypothetical protein [archaeon]
MKKIFFAFALVLLLGTAQALVINAPNEIATNSALSLSIDFDGGTWDKSVKVDGTSILELHSYNGTLTVDSVDKSKVVAESIDESKLYLILNGFKETGEKKITVSDVEASINVFTPISEGEYSDEFKSLKATMMSYADDIDELKRRANELNELAAANKSDSSEFKSKLEEFTSTVGGIQSELLEKASQNSVEQSFSDLEQSLEQQGITINQLREETEEFTSTGFISLGDIQNDPRLALVGLLLAVAVVAVAIAKGKVKLPKMPGLPKMGKKDDSIYTPSDNDEKITSQVLDDAVSDDGGSGKWAFKDGSWTPKNEPDKKIGALGSLIKRD